MLELNKIYCGDCLNCMKDIDSDSVDGIVTDPPYQLSSPNTKKATKGFMGKSWDICPSVEIWQECLRVLKPGAFAFVMCIPRQDCLARMICRLEDAGFNISFSSVLHTFASGFPKAQNLSKAVDKRAGAEQEVIGRKGLHIYKTKRGQWDTATSLRQEFNKIDALTAPATPQAKALDGAYSGMQLKPAVEIVIVAMRPLEEKTYLDQALKNGHGCTWLDDTRIPFEVANKPKGGYGGMDIGIGKPSTHQEYRKEGNANNKGRFPANVLCEDDVLNDGIERKSGAILTHYTRSGNSNLGKTFKIRDRTGEFADWKSNSGEYSRYFSLDSWFAERIKLLPKEAQKTFPWLIIPKASKSEKNRGLEDIFTLKEGTSIEAIKEIKKLLNY